MTLKTDTVLSYHPKLQAVYETTVHFAADMPAKCVDVVVDKEGWERLGEPHKLVVVITPEED